MRSKLVASVVQPIFVGFLVLMTLGELYWIWISIKLGSFAMFVVGVMGITAPVTCPVGVYMMFYGVPHWVHQLFG